MEWKNESEKGGEVMAKTLGDLLVGARVVDPNTKYYGVPIVWRIMEHNHEGDPENSTAVISDKVLCLKAFDARDRKIKILV